ncbi:MAG: hypothetical protein ACAH83_08060 [Alphaproteobacteria bacterium]
MTTHMTRIIAIAAASFIVFQSVCAVAAPVGHVTDVVGKVILKRAGISAPVKKGDGIDQDDVFQAEEKSRVKIVFADKTEFIVAGPGKVTIDTYVYDPKNAGNSKAEFSVLGAAFSYVGGLIEKGKDSDVKLNLDFGSIGIRGTKVYRAMNNNECWIYVERGRVDVKNGGGAVRLKPGQGTIMSSRAKAPADPHIWNAKDRAWIKAQLADPRIHKKDWK